jgi:ABC-2 type transport system ATP-binding protein
MTQDCAVVAEQLVRTYGSVRALDGLELRIAAGSVCAVIGPNGSGKTTAIRVLATLTIPDGGRAFVMGHDVVREAGAVRASIGLAGQHAAVDDDLTGRENLEVLGRMHHLGRREARRRGSELLDRFDLAAAGDRLVKTWSGGMRRRLDLVATFIVAPPVLFLDEPTTGLDPRSRNEIWSTIRDLAAAGTTVLLTTQYMEEADQLADDLVIIDAGRAVANGSPDTLKNKLGVYVDVVAATAADLSATATVLGRWTGTEPAIDRHRQLVSIRIDPATTLPDIVRRLDTAGLGVQDVGIRRPTLDEVFLQLTAGPHKEIAV